MASALSFSASLAGARLSAQQGPSRARVAPVAARAGAIGPGKKWESYETNKNGKVVRKPMHVRTGDLVVVIAGNDKGTTGKVERVNTKTGQLFLEGVNMKTKHQKSTTKDEPGKKVEMEAPIHHSNVMHWSEAEKVRSRVKMQINSDGKKVRVLKKTGEVLPN